MKSNPTPAAPPLSNGLTKPVKHLRGYLGEHAELHFKRGHRILDQNPEYTGRDLNTQGGALTGLSSRGSSSRLPKSSVRG